MATTANQKKLYFDATACLEIIVQDLQNVENIDFPVLEGYYERCSEILHSLEIKECSMFFIQLLHQLTYSVFIQKKMLHQFATSQKNHNKKPSDLTPPDIKIPTASDLRIQQAVENTIITKDKLNLRFKDIIGLEEAKETLMEAIIFPWKYPHFFTGDLKPWCRILLYGPPGTGKSRLANAVTAEIPCIFFNVSSSDLISSWVGESEKIIRRLFQTAKQQNKRSVIFMDEIDSLCRRRTANEDEHNRRIKTELLVQMESTDKFKNIFLLCATNCPWELDPAFLRRFQKRIYIPLPASEARKHIMKLHCKHSKIDISEKDWNVLAEATEGFSGSDLANLTLTALFRPLKELSSAKYWIRSNTQLIPSERNCPGAVQCSIHDIPTDRIGVRSVMFHDFLRALKSTRKTVTEPQLLQFSDFTNSFGEWAL